MINIILMVLSVKLALAPVLIAKIQLVLVLLVFKVIISKIIYVKPV